MYENHLETIERILSGVPNIKVYMDVIYYGDRNRRYILVNSKYKTWFVPFFEFICWDWLLSVFDENNQ